MGLLCTDVQKPHPDYMDALGQKYTCHRLEVASMELTQNTLTVDKDWSDYKHSYGSRCINKDTGKEKIMNEYDFYCIVCGKSLHEAEHKYCKECEKKGELKALYEDVMKIDPEIRFSTICDMNAKITHSRHRHGVKNLLTPEESERSLQEAVNIWELRNKLAQKIGKGRYVLAVYEKIKRITMPLDDNHLLYVTTEVNADHAKIIDGILNLKARLK